MSLLTKGLDILSARLGLKRSRPASEEAPPPRHDADSLCTEDQALQGLGRCSLHTGGSTGSALKRSRVCKTDPCAGASAAPALGGQVGARCQRLRLAWAQPPSGCSVPVAHIAVQPPINLTSTQLPRHRSVQTGLPFATFDNPLFQDDDSEEEDEFELIGGGNSQLFCGGGNQLEQDENTGWLGNISLPGGSASPPLRRLNPAATSAFAPQRRSLPCSGLSPVLGSGSSKPFAGICGSGNGSGGSTSDSEVLAAFRRQVESPLVLSALCALERARLHPLGADSEDFFDSLEGTCAGAPSADLVDAWVHVVGY